MSLQSRHQLALVLISAGCLLPVSLTAQPVAGRFGPDTTIDVLLGDNERAKLATTLGQRLVGGRAYSWDQYAAWGTELLHNGQVRNPPVGPGPSRLLAERYRCVHCHNLQREDTRLPIQDPETRERLIRASAPADPSVRDGTVLNLAPGTTLWGAVNRDSFYNGHFAKYRSQKLTTGQPMDPTKVLDAIEVCCRYCSGGRYPEQWELDAMLVAHWELEIRLKDLDLAPDEQRRALDALNGSNAQEIANARAVIRRSYLHVAGATKGSMPQRSEGDTDFYDGGARITGDAKAGKFVYQSACAGCHGTSVNSLAGKALLMDDRRFHFYTRDGTERDGLYMPMFSTQRLSRPQAADVRAYLRTLPK